MYMDVVQVFIEAGTDVNVRDRRGRTFLHKAIGDEEFVAALVESGADVNARVRLFGVNTQTRSTSVCH